MELKETSKHTCIQAQREPGTSQTCLIKDGKVTRGKGQMWLIKPEAPLAFKSTIALSLGPFCVLERQQERGILCSQSIRVTPRPLKYKPADEVQSHTWSQANLISTCTVFRG